MALTLNSTPGTYYSAHGDLIFVVYESVKALDPNTYPDYKYVADVYVNNLLVTRLKRVPQPDNKRGIFNIGQIVRDYVSAKFNPAPSQLRAQELGEGEFFVTVQLKFGEEYNYTLTTNLLSDSARVYFNHYNGRLVGANTQLPDYTNKVASARPLVTSVGDNDVNIYLPYFPTSTATFPVVATRLINGVASGSLTVNITPTVANGLQVLNLGKASLGILLSNDVGAYTVQINNGTIYKFIRDCDPRYQNYNLHFLNRFGGFDTKNFNKVSKKTIEIDKKGFGKLPYQVDSNGAVSYHNSNKVYHETKATYSSQYTEKLTLNSDILSDEEYEWLSDLILSPLVYLEDNGYFIPVQIKASNYDFKKRVVDKLTNLTVEVEFGNQLNAQYR